jgi:hypothetical protein
MAFATPATARPSAAPRAAAHPPAAGLADPYSDINGITTSMGEFDQSGPPSCAPPAEPPPTVPGRGGSGYTVPFLVRITNGAILGGFTQSALQAGQQVPWALQAFNITGWITGSIALPSLKVDVQPADVVICNTTIAFKLETPQSPPASYQLNGVKYPAGALVSEPIFTTPYTYPGRAPGTVHNHPVITPTAVSMAVAGIGPSGSIVLDATLSAIMGLDWTHDPPTDLPPLASCVTPSPITMSLSTAPESVVPPTPITEAGTSVTPPVGPPPPRVFLPTSPLDRATTGGSAVVGADDFSFVTPSMAAPPTPAVPDPHCIGTAPPALIVEMYGFNAKDLPYFSNADQAAMSRRLGDPYPAQSSPGLAEFSADATLQDFGIPSGAPTGFGFAP